MLAINVYNGWGLNKVYDVYMLVIIFLLKMWKAKN